MYVVLTISRYKAALAWAGFLSMALFHISFSLRSKKKFYKLLGTGLNGSFDIMPDLKQWALMTTISKTEMESFDKGLNLDSIYGSFIAGWMRFWHCEVYQIILEPREGHGTWDGNTVFGKLNENRIAADKPIAVLTRATIRFNKLKHFWRHVAPVSEKMNTAEGFIFSIGIGEVPWIKQATFSVWQHKEAMQQFAYRLKEHKEVIEKTRSENWYSEDMFVRFTIVSTSGTLKGCNPLSSIL